MANSSPQSKARPCDQVGFLSLPAELRLIIYGELLIRPEPIEFVYNSKYDHDGVHSMDPDPTTMVAKHLRLTKTIHPAILRTCKQIKCEALPILYAENVFKSDSNWDEEGWMSDFVACIGKENSKMVKHMVVSMFEYSDPDATEIASATWRHRFNFELLADLTGACNLDIEIGTWAFERPFDWIYHVDYQLRNLRATRPAIKVMISIFACVDEVYIIPEDILGAWETVGWTHRAVEKRLILMSTCCRERATCRPTCNRDWARWVWADFSQKCGNYIEVCRCGKDHPGEPVWIGRKDWNDDDSMPEAPKGSVLHDYEGIRSFPPGSCMVSYRKWPVASSSTS